LTKVKTHQSRQNLAESLSDDIVTKLSGAIKHRGFGSIAVSGGSTPALLFKTLSSRHLDWQNIRVTLVDERCVPISDNRSNAKLVANLLLQNEAASANFTPMYLGAYGSSPDISDIENRLRPLLDLDVVVLGMGNDGHTASFFPGGKGLAQATDKDTKTLVCAVEADAAIEPRLTLTLPVLLAADLLVIHIEGDEKLSTMKTALDGGDANDMPVRHVLRNRPDVEIH